jgi:hypothetical protein
MWKKSLPLLLILASCLLLGSGSSGAPAYSKDGQLLFPANYRNWTFLTAGLGMTYGPADKTQLVLEIRGSDSKASINKDGRFQKDVVAVEVHVKDRAKGGWAFYGFRPGAASSPMIPKTQDCYSCHEKNGAVDTTFVQFYPTLQAVHHDAH